MTVQRTRRGIDVSDNQKVIDWGKVKAAGVAFAALRSVRGSGKTDYQFHNNLAGVRAQGIPFDVYKYSYGTTPEKQKTEAQQVVDLLKSCGVEDCTVWWDMEDKTLRLLGKEKLTALIKVAKVIIEAAGYEFGIYCNVDWYKNVLDPTAFSCRFWVARYPSKKEMQLEDTPNDKYKPQITQELFGWQYSSTGRVDGISTSVDLDLIYEDLEQNEAPKDYSAPYAEPTYTLYRGRLAQKVEYVKWLQWHLIKVGVLKSHTAEGKSNLDGSFGKRTEAALVAFQTAHKETYSTKEPDKKCGKKTRAALIAAVKAL